MSATTHDHTELRQDPIETVEALYRTGWSDGLPLVPPYRERVEEFVQYTGLDGGHEIGTIPPHGGRATVERLAANAVMAGCLPEYMPVLLAAVDAVLEEKFNLRGMLASTQMSGPMLIINGPIRRSLKVNYESSAFGTGFRANATIGRALQLVLRNIGGALPGESDKATLGSPAKYTNCIGENEERNPWDPFHVERGFEKSESTVTVYAAEGPHNVTNQYSNEPRSLLLGIVSMMVNLGSNQPYMMGDHYIVMSPEHAGVVAEAGWKKRDIKNFFYEHARVPMRDLTIGGFYGPRTDRYMLWPRWVDRNDPDALMPVCRDADDFKIIVAGGPGKHSAYVPGLGSRSITRKISIPA